MIIFKFNLELTGNLSKNTDLGGEVSSIILPCKIFLLSGDLNIRLRLVIPNAVLSRGEPKNEGNMSGTCSSGLSRIFSLLFVSLFDLRTSFVVLMVPAAISSVSVSLLNVEPS